jgi:2-aminoadipate transaminase
VEASSMTATGVDRFQGLLSQRAAKGPRPPMGGGPGMKFRFSAGNPDPGSFPYQELVQAMADVMETDGENALSYGAVFGHQPLREWVCHKLKVFEDLDVSPDNILITNGSGDAIGLIIQTFIDEGDVVITEAPTFSATLQALRRNGAELYGVEMDDEGILIDQVKDRLAALKAEGKRCKMIYTIVNFQNPFGPTMSLKRRKELLALAKENDIVILEDDAYGELRWEGEPLPSLFALDDAGLVARTGTFSKILGAGTRVGWIVAPSSMVPYLSAFNFGGGVAPLTSRVCLAYMNGHLESHVADLIQIYKNKRDAMLETLETGLAGTDAAWNRPEGGFFIWLKLPSGTNQKKLLELATQAGIAYALGPSFFPDGGGEEHIRLAFSLESIEGIREGVGILCTLIHQAR